MRRLKQILKLIIKTFISFVCYFLFRFLKVNKENWDKRILIIFGGGVGDVVKRSVICNFVKEYLNEYEIYYLLPYKLTLPYSYKIFYFDYKKTKTNPFYFAQLVKNLKKIGFSRVIILLPFWENFLWLLGKSLSPSVLYVPLETPPSRLEKILNLVVSSFFIFSIKKHFKLIKVISIFDKKLPMNVFPSDVYKNSYFISQVIKDIKPDLILSNIGLLQLEKIQTELIVNNEKEKLFLEKLENEYNLEPEKYCIIGLGSSSSHKNWAVKNFVEVAKYVKNVKQLQIVLVGGKESIELANEFKNLFQEQLINLINRTTLEELCILIKNSKLIIANDTSFIHIGIAFKKHTICPILNTQLGVDSLYGYEEINQWVFVNEDPDINSLLKITPQMVIKVLEKIYNNYPIQFKLFFNDG